MDPNQCCGRWDQPGVVARATAEWHQVPSKGQWDADQLPGTGLVCRCDASPMLLTGSCPSRSPRCVRVSLGQRQGLPGGYAVRRSHFSDGPLGRERLVANTGKISVGPQTLGNENFPEGARGVNTCSRLVCKIQQSGPTAGLFRIGEVCAIS